MRKFWEYIIGKRYWVIVLRGRGKKRYLSKDGETWTDDLSKVKRFYTWQNTSGDWRYGTELIYHHECKSANDWKFEYGEYVRCKRCYICQIEIKENL